MIYMISDTHFNHDRAFIYRPRGFRSVKESNDTIIRNWNRTVRKEDDVYMLGDFFLGSNTGYIKKVVPELNGRIHLIIGNHDTPAKRRLYSEFPNIVEVVWATQIEYKGRKFYLSHYPTITADLQSNPDTAVFNIFGHIHTKEKFYEDRPYMYNVACDAHESTPISIEHIYADIMKELDECRKYLV